MSPKMQLYAIGVYNLSNNKLLSLSWFFSGMSQQQ